jgi:hypothetical protein
MHRPGTRIASFTFACLVALLLSTPGADARERMGRSRVGAAKSGQVHRTVTRTGADGTARTSTHDTSWQRGGGQYSRDTLHTGPGGKQGTTHVEGARTSDGAVRDVTRTGPGGQTATTHDELHRTDGGYTRETTHTGPNGGVTTRNATGSYDPETKSWSKDVTRTNPNGSTATTHVDGQRTDTGYTKTTTHTGPNGGVTTQSATGSYDPASKTFTRDATTTRPDGSTATSHTEGTRTDGGYQQTTTHTGPKGTTTTTGEGTWDPETKTWTREKVVTRPDGSSSKTEVTRQVAPGAPEAAPAE